MKNLNLRDLFKKLLSLGTAFALMQTPVMAKGEGEETEKTNEDNFVLVMQNKEIAPMTLEEYRLGVQNAYAYLSQFINYDNMQGDLQCLYYLVNREYMDDGLEEELINNGIVYETNFEEQKYDTFIRSYNLINMISEYNQSTIQNLDNKIDLAKVQYESYDKDLLRYYLNKVINDVDYTILDAIVDYNNIIEKDDVTKVIDLDDMCVSYDAKINEYLTKVINDDNYDLRMAISDYNEALNSGITDELIDVSKLCYDEYDSKLVHDMQVNYIKAYQAGIIDGEYFEMVFKQLTNLNAREHAGNVAELSVGARFIAQNVIGGEFMQMIRDFLGERYSKQELSEYFVLAELNKQQWILREDKPLEFGCLKNELEVAVWYFAQAWSYVYDHVNDDIMKTFENDCIKSK